MSEPSERAQAAERVRRVALPDGAEPPYRVYVNGEELREGPDFTVEAGALVFARPLRPQPPLGLGRRIMLAIGIGVYGDLRGDALDVQFQRGGARQLANDVRFGDEATRGWSDRS